MKLKTVLPPALFLTAMLVAAPNASAQKSYAVGVTGGVAIPTGKFSDPYANGFTITAFVGLGVPDLPIGIRIDGVYNEFSGRTVTPAGGGASVDTPDLRLLGVVGNLIYSFPGTTAKPYVVTGGGFYNSKDDVSGTKSKNDLGFSAGLGATFGLGPLAAILEARYHSISREAASGGNIHFVPISLGIVF